MADTENQHMPQPQWHYHTKSDVLYRYRVADPGLRLMRNTYGPDPEHGITGTAWIGIALVIGRYAYCIRWGKAELIRQETNHD